MLARRKPKVLPLSDVQATFLRDRLSEVCHRDGNVLAIAALRGLGLWSLATNSEESGIVLDKLSPRAEETAREETRIDAFGAGFGAMTKARWPSCSLATDIGGTCSASPGILRPLAARRSREKSYNATARRTLKGSASIRQRSRLTAPSLPGAR
jgi:hypothetical protein